MLRHFLAICLTLLKHSKNNSAKREMQLDNIPQKGPHLHAALSELDREREGGQFAKKRYVPGARTKGTFYEFFPSSCSSSFHFCECLQKITILLCVLRKNVNLPTPNMSQPPFTTANHLWISYKQGSFIVEIR